MNRQERRAAQKQRNPTDAIGPDAAPAAVLQLCAEAAWHQQQGRPDKAVRLYRRALAIKPDFAKALNNLGAALLTQGKSEQAAVTFRQLLLLMPELFDSYSDLMTILIRVNPQVGNARTKASAAWPRLLSADELFGSRGLAPIAGDPLLRTVLEANAVRDVGLERVLTSLRCSVLGHMADGIDRNIVEPNLAFCCALATQCFINEYVFAVSQQELEQLRRLREAFALRLSTGASIPPIWLAVLSCYMPLHALSAADVLFDRRWPEPINHLLTQQLREPDEERRILASIPHLTAIADEVSLKVREQYEENPYPRWILAPSRRAPLDVNAYLRQEFPTADFRDIDTAAGMEMLIAGCGTGQHPIGMARLLANVRVLAIDLSLNSLSYARRKTRELGISNIEYAHADILQMANLDRHFDVIDSSGVLHHLADPLAGWRILLSLLRPGGLMHVALYSEIARRDVVAARAFIAERGYQPTPEDIRRCRQDLMTTPLQSVARIYDYFSMSECRDLLFHIQEHRLTIPAIQSFLRDNGLIFIGFKVSPAVRMKYASRFPGDRAMTNLDYWHAFEQDNPGTFLAMYQLWMQKA
jgi:2-polyprenyl-3-methyl-5-hydroxy-6-metoxy-1,4-benzoquinol methylase